MDEYSSTLSSGINQGYSSWLPLLQTGAAQIITEIKTHEHKPPCYNHFALAICEVFVLILNFYVRLLKLVPKFINDLLTPCVPSQPEAGMLI